MTTGCIAQLVQIPPPCDLCGTAMESWDIVDDTRMLGFDLYGWECKECQIWQESSSAQEPRVCVADQKGRIDIFSGRLHCVQKLSIGYCMKHFRPQELYQRSVDLQPRHLPCLPETLVHEVADFLNSNLHHFECRRYSEQLKATRRQPQTDGSPSIKGE